jgi:acyl transferase domain-containing protein
LKIAKEKIAVVGMSFRPPGARLGNISNCAAFWQALLTQQDLVTEMGPGRWDTSLFYPPDPSILPW